ncbi:MAG TPA: hypothetical protein VGH42_00365 [Verrucomicrobiae bacterium]|jgi:hypothetical protein
MTTRFQFFDLKTPADLFRKLEGDFAALKASYQDTRIAFNFFVTAEHLPDWLGKRDLIRQHAFLKIVSHIANGAKHFKLDATRHDSVTSTEKSRYMEEGYYEPGYFHEPLLIHLSPDEASAMNTPTIDAVTLGRQVIEFWRRHIPKDVSPKH